MNKTLLPMISEIKWNNKQDVCVVIFKLFNKKAL